MYGTSAGGSRGNGTIFALTPPPAPVPPLQITTTGISPAVFWPNDGLTHTLQTTTNLASGPWLAVSNGMPLVGLQLTNAAGQPQAFLPASITPVTSTCALACPGGFPSFHLARTTRKRYYTTTDNAGKSGQLVTMKLMESTETASPPPTERPPAGSVLSPAVQAALLPVATRVFWWGQPQAWLNDPSRLVAQVMTYGDWNDTVLTLELLGESFSNRC